MWSVGAIEERNRASFMSACLGPQEYSSVLPIQQPGAFRVSALTVGSNRPINGGRILLLYLYVSSSLSETLCCLAF